MRGAIGLAVLLGCSSRAPASGDGSAAPAALPATPAPAAPTSPPAPPAPAPAGPWQLADDGWVDGVLAAARAREPVLDAALADPAAIRLQIAVTEATADAGAPGGWRLVGHGYRTGAEYVYTASAMKLAVSVGALAEVARLRAAGVPLTLDTPLALCPLGPGPCAEAEDPSNLDGGTITIGHELRKMHLVSDNQAFGRLLDLVGAAALRAQLGAWGLPDVRLAYPMDVYAETPPPSPRIELRLPGGVQHLPERAAPPPPPPLTMPGARIGVAYILGGERHAGPRDMSTRNYASVADLHRLLLAVVAPGVDGIPRLGLADDLRAFLLRAMTQEPTASQNPRYDDPALDGARYRPAVAGVERVRPRTSLRIVSKAGRAYGFYTENAWIEDVAAGRGVALTATIYADDDGVIGDDRYRYDELARPILAALGEQLTRQLLGSL